MRTKSIFTLAIMLITLSLTTLSCKKDVSSTTGGSGNSGNTTNCDDPEGAITANLRNDDGYITLLDGKLKMNTADNFVFEGQNHHTRTFVNIGEYNGLGCVDDIPTTGWSNQVAVIPGNGYIVKDYYYYNFYEEESYVKYARIYVSRYILSANHEILGAEIKYQDNWCAEPKVSTKNVTSITQTTATCGGIIDDGGMNITEMGICWCYEGTIPTVNNYHVAANEITENYTLLMTGLIPNSTYNVRAYVISNANVIYGGLRQFSTMNTPTLAIITTNNATNITQSSATCGGNITSNGGSTITECGICWSTSTNPNIHSSHTSSFITDGSFTIEITGLQSATKYYARAYATNGTGTSYGEEISFTTLHEWQNGILPGLFSVSKTKKVNFSQGNLQYKASTDTWRFAGSQHEIVGVSNANISSSYNGWIDLFGWGTSGWDNGNVFYHPYDSDNTNGAWYGPSGGYNLSGSYINSDWGVYNAISNGGNNSGMWRTLAKFEWNYLLFERNTAYGIRFAKAYIDGVAGIILLPDDWNPGYYSLYNTNSVNQHYYSNNISATEWNTLESLGAVFLPASSYRKGNIIENWEPLKGYYWTSSYVDNTKAKYIEFNDSQFFIGDRVRYEGFSVRLIRDAH